MKIKLSKMILISSVIGMVLVGISLANIYKTDIVVKDIYGKREALGEMDILIQKTGGLFETDQIVINKDGEKEDKFVKQGNQFVNLNKENIDNRYLFTYENDENILFEDENSVGMVVVSPYSIIDNKEKMGANIEIKDKKSGKIESYEIEMGDPIDIAKNYVCSTLPIKKEGDNLYVAVMYSYYNYSNDEEDFDDSELLSKNCKNTNLSLYKLNLYDETSKCVLSQDYEGKNLSLKESAFSNDNKAYFIVNKKDNKSNIYKTNLLEFDVNTKDINLIDLGIKEDYITKACNVENGEMLLISILTSDDLSGESSGVLEESKDVKAILVDLKNKNIKYKHTLDMKYTKQPYMAYEEEFMYVNRVKRNDGKIYAISPEYTSEGSSREVYNTPYRFYVFDEKNGEKLYEGSVEINSNYSVNMGIVKNDRK